MSEGEKDDPFADFFTPGSLLDCIEEFIRRLYPSWDGSVEEEPEPLLTMLIPDLRHALRDAGLNVPLYGPHSAPCAIESGKAWLAKCKDARETALYRWWDAADVLLYIGIADHIGSRTKDHAKGSSWMEFAVGSAVERFPSRSIALAAEESAIKAEHPIFNKQHNDTPEARRRLVEYLIERDRLDLLAPAVSRG